MKRRHLFEFEDLPWFPPMIRNFMTDFLRFMSSRFDFYRSVVWVIEKGLQQSGGDTVIDLASGAGGGWAKLVDHIGPERPELKVILTDRYPNTAGMARSVASHPGVFEIEHDPIDAREVPARLRGLRTQFLSLHHFKPEDAKQILQNAVDAGQPIAVFEAQKRNVEHLIKFALAPIGVLLMTPFVRPFRWSRLLFTYVIPVVPVCTLWDGVVSVLRVYSTDELTAMTKELVGGEKYVWEIGEEKTGQVTVPYLLGYPATGEGKA